MVNSLNLFLSVPDDVINEYFNYEPLMKNSLRKICRQMNQSVAANRKAVSLSYKAFSKEETARLIETGDYCARLRDPFLTIALRSPRLEKVIFRDLPQEARFHTAFLQKGWHKIQSIELFYSTTNPFNSFPAYFLASAKLVTLSFRILLFDETYSRNSILQLKQLVEMSPNLTSLTYREDLPTNIVAYEGSFGKYQFQTPKPLSSLFLTTYWISNQALDQVKACKSLTHLEITETCNEYPPLYLWLNYLKSPNESLELFRLNNNYPNSRQLSHLALSEIKGLHTFECLGLNGFNDDHLIQLASQNVLQSLALNFELISDRGFHEFTKKASELRRLVAKGMKQITSIKPLADHCKKLTFLKCLDDETKISDFAELQRLSSLKTLTLKKASFFRAEYSESFTGKFPLLSNFVKCYSDNELSIKIQPRR